MDVPSAKRFITSLLESRVEEGRSVSYITSAKKKDEDKLMFTVTRGFDLLLSRYQKLCAQRITGKKGDRLLFYVTRSPISICCSTCCLCSMWWTLP